ncbi:hypothetical protein JMN32_02420 [Fulvivirga sp. 29W222]|uniref:DUF4412 domain-containing protein n=1 Tax=Fulvivirga marina TaxID=2494733 RepID=A0A937KCN0_9BACT|nr:hypothetical protein [Fulvivirga marina]MBL6445145.1 hypothetical protein [Fulvivirga marina]
MKYIAPLVITLLSLAHLTAQSQDTETIIKDIRSKYATVMGLKDKEALTVEVLEYRCPDFPEEGTITYYSQDEEVKLIEHSFSEGDHYGGKNQYLVWEGKLFFYFSDVGYWTFDMGTGDEDEPVSQTKDIITESRFYFDNEEAVKCLSKNYEIRSRDAEKVKPENIPNEEINCFDSPEIMHKFKAIMELKGKGVNGECIWNE